MTKLMGPFIRIEFCVPKYTVVLTPAIPLKNAKIRVSLISALFNKILNIR